MITGQILKGQWFPGQDKEWDKNDAAIYMYKSFKRKD